MNTLHYDYGALASRISISNLQKNTDSSFFSVAQRLHENDLLSDEVWSCVQENQEAIESAIDFKRDFLIDYFGFKTLERAYLMRVNKVIQERPQICGCVLQWEFIQITLKKHWKHMTICRDWYSHTRRQLFNAGTLRPQLSSCFC